MTVAAAAQAIGARVIGPDVVFDGVSTDTRTIGKGALFVALRGERFDGHDYLDVARAQGAAAAMVDRVAGFAGKAGELPLILVGDTRMALGTLAKHWRRRFDIPVIAVTGSNGKTTVKEMIAACLREHHGSERVLATAGNLNNDIGLPLTLLRLREHHACAVVELGMNHPGETAYLAEIAGATVALVNNAQREHQEFMKSVADVAEEHAAAFAALPASGVAIVNADDAFAARWIAVAGRRTVRTFGLSAAAAVTATFATGDAGTRMHVATQAGAADLTLHVPGEHNVRNALAAIAAVTAIGVPLAAAARALEGFRAVKGRMQPRQGRQGARIIDDTYNANPDSVRAAIDVLAAAPAPRLLVLGDMGEVGDQGPAFHEEIGRYARERGIERLLAVGTLARAAARAFGPGAEHLESVDAAIARAQGMLGGRPTILVKGSRFMRMERVVEHLVATEAG